MLPEFQVENALWFGIGAALGAIASWSFQAMRYARRAARTVDKLEDEMRDDGQTDLKAIAIGVMVVAVCVAAVLAGFAADRSTDANNRVKSVASCTQRILQQTIGALNARTQLTDKQYDARNDVLITQRNLVDALLDPEAPPQTQVDLARRYREAVNRQLSVDRRTAETRVENPYPTVEEIRECR